MSFVIDLFKNFVYIFRVLLIKGMIFFNVMCLSSSFEGGVGKMPGEMHRGNNS